MINEKSHQ